LNKIIDLAHGAPGARLPLVKKTDKSREAAREPQGHEIEGNFPCVAPAAPPFRDGLLARERDEL
jgi:hypothetical protein